MLESLLIFTELAFDCTFPLPGHRGSGAKCSKGGDRWRSCRTGLHRTARIDGGRAAQSGRPDRYNLLARLVRLWHVHVRARYGDCNRFAVFCRGRGDV